MEISITTTKGQIVIPRIYRRKYGIAPGTKVGFIEKDGNLIIKALNKEYFESLAGWLKEGDNLLDELKKEKKSEREL